MEKPNISVGQEDQKPDFFSGNSSRNLAERIEAAVDHLSKPLEPEVSTLEKKANLILLDIISRHPPTWQEKTTNLSQTVALAVAIVEQLNIRRLLGDASTIQNLPLLIDLGAGKALLSRLIYELVGRKIDIIAVDVRNAAKNYDPKTNLKEPRQSVLNRIQKAEKEFAELDFAELRSIGNTGSGKFSRIVQDIQNFQINAVESKGNIIVIAKHLCGGATDFALERIVKHTQSHEKGLAPIKLLCIAPCCHQKTKFLNYCNRNYLDKIGLGGVHIFKSLVNLIQLSRHKKLKSFEYKRWKGLQNFEFDEVKTLGRNCRRILEEGRMMKLRENGFQVELVKYTDELTTPDNLIMYACMN